MRKPNLNMPRIKLREVLKNDFKRDFNIVNTNITDKITIVQQINNITELIYDIQYENNTVEENSNSTNQSTCISLTNQIPFESKNKSDLAGRAEMVNAELIDWSNVICPTQEMQVSENIYLGTATNSTEGTSNNDSTDPSSELNNFETRIKNGEFDSIEPNSDKWNEYINLYSDLIKADLKSKYNYSDDFIDSMLSFSTRGLLGKNMFSLDFCLTDALKTIKDKMEQLKEPPQLAYLFQQSNGSIFNQWNEGGLTVDNIRSYIKFNNYHNIGEQYFIWLFRNTFSQNNYNEFEEYSLITNVFTEIANIIGKTDDKFILSDLEMLDQNSVGGFLDEIFEIINEKVKDIIHIEDSEWQSATTLDYSLLFTTEEGMNAEYIEEHLNEMLLSSDSGVRRFANLINNALFVNNCSTVQERENCIKWIIALINAENGIHYTKDEGKLFVGQIDIPVTFLTGITTTITISITEDDNIIALTEEEAIQYVNDHLEEFIEKWAVENQEQIVSLDNLPQISMEAADKNGINHYWTGAVNLDVTLSDGTTRNISITVDINDKVAAGTEFAAKQYIINNLSYFLSKWENENPRIYIDSWKNPQIGVQEIEVYEYTKDALINGGLNSYEMWRYFQQLNDGSYILKTDVVDRDFPGKKIRDIKYLTSILSYQDPTTNNIYLTPEELSELGDNVFDKLEEILNSEKLKNLMTLNDVNGVIEDFSQGNENDCWLLAGLIAMNSTLFGQEMIRNAINWSEDYSSVNVRFKDGTIISLTIDEILDFKYNSSEHVDCNFGGRIANVGDGYDDEVMILELAFNKYIGEIGGQGDAPLFTDHRTASSFFTWFGDYGHTDRHTAGGVDDILDFATGWLTSVANGGKIDIDSGNIKEYLAEILYNMQTYGFNCYAATFALFTAGAGTDYSANTIDGEKWEYEMSMNGHVLAITDITEDTVTFVNPHDSTESFTVTWDEFAHIGIAQFSVTYY